LQIVNINRLSRNLPNFILPRLTDVNILFGEYQSNDERVSDDKIRAIDKKNLESEIQPYVNSLPEKVIDRSRMDYWNLVRQFNWRVSPTPVRVLTQVLTDSPYDIWTWNRTMIVDKLREHGFNSLANSYTNYYIIGWKLFLSKFTNFEYYRTLIKNGYLVLSQSISILKSL
ncbi:MAG: hypothetical protein KAT16_09090, partial [Candidatus Heimdallarchaeota archaeon]|nr:hypothetical protein [Candidatus Heimdallarchaeota archaeon]